MSCTGILFCITAFPINENELQLAVKEECKAVIKDYKTDPSVDDHDDLEDVFVKECSKQYSRVDQMSIKYY